MNVGSKLNCGLHFMPRKRVKSRDRIEQDFIDALDRIRDGRPQHPDLREKMRKGKTIKVSFATVALEAGRARGLISKMTCRYPEVRQRILLETGEIAASRDDVISSLRAQVADLRVQLKQAEAHAAYHFAMRTKAEKDAVFKKRYQQLKARIAADERQRMGSSAKVVPLFLEESPDVD